MGVHAAGDPADRAAPGEDALTGEPLPPLRRVNVDGDLDDLLDHRPFFRTRLHGYDRLQVDNYVAWVEAELATARRQSSHLLIRYGRCAAELEQLRRAPASPSRYPELTVVTERLGRILGLAAEEAAVITAAGIDEAERTVREARAEADARLQKVWLIREATVAAREDVRRERSEAARILATARAQAAAMLAAAEAERNRLARESAARLARQAEEALQGRESAAVAAARLVEVQAEMEDLRRQRDEARASLHRLRASLGETAAATAPEVPAQPGAPPDAAAPGDVPVPAEVVAPGEVPVPAQVPVPGEVPVQAGRRQPVTTSAP
jgi:cell division septum initiation protein DivIVA